MKKALIALAVLGAASGVAMAQSSVTLYGTADIGLGKAKSAGDQKWGAQSNSIVTNGTSQIGLTGKEDLGGGLWAGFTFAGAVNLANGAGGDGGGVTGGPLWSRSAFLALGSNNFGTVKLGRNYTPSFDAQAAYELTGLANYSVLANTYGFGGYPDPRNNVQFEYQTPNFAGLSAELAYIPKADGALINDGQANRSDRWDANVVYAQGPIKAAINANKSRSTITGGNGNKVNWAVGGSYTFGKMFALSASYNRANSAQLWKGAGGAPVWGARRYGWELGGSFFTGPFTVTLDLTRDTKNDLYAGRKYTNGLLEGKYSLSKRTFLYADYLRLDGDNNYGLGICHSF
jgi:predicted porin